MNPPRRFVRQSLLSFFLIPVLSLYCLLAMFPLRRATGALAYPFQLDNVEGFLLDEAVQLSHGHGIYNPIATPPYLVANYPPVYQLAWAALIDAAGPSLTHGRVLCFASLGGILVALLIMALRCGGQAAPALLCPLLFLATYECNNWAAYARVDLPAIFLSVTGLACFTAEKSRTARAAALVFFALAFFTKQTAVLAPAACALHLLARDWRKGIVFGAAFAAVVATATALFTALTRGQYWLHTVVYNANAMDWSKLGNVWLPHLWRFYHFYLAALAIALLHAFWRAAMALRARDSVRPATEAEVSALPEEGSSPDTEPSEDAVAREGAPSEPAADAASCDSPIPPAEAAPQTFSSSERLGVYALYFILAALSIASLAKAGSAENYLLEPLAAAALLFGSALSLAFGESANAPRAWTSRFFAVAMLAAIATHGSWFVRGNLGGVGAPVAPAQAAFLRGMRVDREEAKDLLEAVRSAQGEVFCEDPVFLVLTGRRPPINPFILTQLAREKKWDETPFVRAIEERRFALVVTTRDIRIGESFDRYTPRMARAFASNYELWRVFDLGQDGQTYYAYRPGGEGESSLLLASSGGGAGLIP